jgi:aspartyl-tRNA(Asn)/glutamyl-tRNA(Gln) amidotransferase subunit A
MPNDLNPSRRTVLDITADLTNGRTSSRELIEAACCAVTDAVMAGEPPIVPPAIPVKALRLGVPQTYVLDGLEADVATAFSGVCTMLSRAGARVADLPLSELAELPAINTSGGLAPIEAYAWHKRLLERRGGEYDPRVRTRIEHASGMTAVEYIQLQAARADLIGRVAAGTSGFDALLMPTVAITAPPIAAFEQDEDYRRLNAVLLRNTSVINFLDCCAVTVPLQTASPPVGLMSAATERTAISSELGAVLRRRSMELISAFKSVFQLGFGGAAPSSRR